MKFGDIVVALGIIGIVLIIIIPIPKPLLSILLSLNIAFSLLILLLSMYTKKCVGNFYISIFIINRNTI